LCDVEDLILFPIYVFIIHLKQAVSNPGYAGLNCGMTVNNELEKIWKEAVMDPIFAW
jgi:hypothetical protein